jgi:hypothetical protein
VAGLDLVGGLHDCFVCTLLVDFGSCVPVFFTARCKRGGGNRVMREVVVICRFEGVESGVESRRVPWIYESLRCGITREVMEPTPWPRLNATFTVALVVGSASGASASVKLEAANQEGEFVTL